MRHDMSNIFRVRADHRIDRDETGTPFHGSVHVALCMKEKETRMSLGFTPQFFHERDADRLVRETLDNFDDMFSQMRRDIECELRKEFRAAEFDMNGGKTIAIPTALDRAPAPESPDAER